MRTTVLSDGVVRSMTKGAPEGASSGEAASEQRMSLLDKLDLLRLVADDPPPELETFLEQLRQAKSQSPPSVFIRLKDIVYASQAAQDI